MDGELLHAIANFIIDNWVTIIVVGFSCYTILIILKYRKDPDVMYLAFITLMERYITTIVLSVIVLIVLTFFTEGLIDAKDIGAIYTFLLGLGALILSWWKPGLRKRIEIKKPQIELAQKIMSSFIIIKALIAYIRDKNVQDEELNKVREHYQKEGYFKGVEDNNIALLTEALVPNYRLHEMDAKIKHFIKLNRESSTYIHSAVYTCSKDMRHIINEIKKASEDRFKLIKEIGVTKIADLRKLNEDDLEKLNKTDRDKLNELAELDEILCYPLSFLYEVNIPLTKKELAKYKQEVPFYRRHQRFFREEKVDELASKVNNAVRKVKLHTQFYIDKL